MRPAVRDRLVQVNRAFYQKLALSFASTRRRPQPGVVRALSGIDPQVAILDVGCGHGLAALELTRAGYHGRYLGLDSSQPLLELAKQRVSAPWARFCLVDLVDPDWLDKCPAVREQPFDRVLAFAVLHHLPGDDLRQRVVKELRSVLPGGGGAWVSVWDFAQSDRLHKRLLPWETIELTESQVDPGDALLDWRHEGSGLRYVHLFTSDALADLATRGGFRVISEYRSDGEGGRMGLYQEWAA